MVQHGDGAGSDRGADLVLERAPDPEGLGQVDDGRDAGLLHHLQGRDVAGEEEGGVGRDLAHVPEVEVVELAVGEVARGVVHHRAHGQLARLEGRLVDVRLE